MRRILSKIFAISLLSLAFAGSVFAKDYPAPSYEFYVNDLANVMSDENEQYIIETNKKLASQTGGQIVVMTVQNLNGDDIETYANKVFNQYGIGDKSKNNGTLILLAIEERQSRIETGQGTEGFIPDGKTGRIQDQHMVPEFRNDNWDKGLRQGFDAILDCYLEEYNIEIDGSTPLSTTDESEAGTASETLFAAVPFALIILSPIVSAISRNNKLLRNLIRIICVVAAILAYAFTTGFAQALILMCCFVLFLASFGIHTSGGGSFRGGSSHSSGGSHGGGGHSAGGGSSRSF